MQRAIVFVIALSMFGWMMVQAARAATSTAASVRDGRRWDGVEGSGILDARAPDGKALGPCPLKHTDVAVELTGFVARVTVTQLFENRFTEPVEAVYTFPLSDAAAVDAMWLRTGDRLIRGTIERREEARKIYEAARDAGKVAGLLDQERPNVFTQSVANLVPGAAVEIKIEYVEPLKYSGGTFEFVFPTVVGPRFLPGAPTGRIGTGWGPDTTRVPDGSRITPPVTPKQTRAGHDLRLSVDIDAGVPILDVAAPLHDVVVTRRDAQHARVRLRERQEIPNRDFVLRYAVAGDQLTSGYLVHRPTSGGDGYVSFVLLPPKRVTPATAAPKELVFVIDRSGSQSGRPLEVAKSTVLWILDHLNPDDTFQIVDFGSTANTLFARPRLVTDESKRRARAHLATLEADGGTMMAEAIEQVCAMPADGNRLRIVTFMTDGYVGNDFEVIDLVRKLRGRSRWFPFGTGNGVNRFLIEGMAREGGGEPEYVLLNDPPEEIARRFYERIASPVLTDVQLEVEGLTLVDTVPRRLRDVWAERPLVVHARYQRPGRGRVVLRGFRQGRPYAQSLEVVLPEREDENAALASMWARSEIDELMAEDLQGLQSGTFRADLRDRVVELALAHALLTQFTSFVAVEDRVVNEGGVQRTVTVPVEMPQGVRYEGVFGEAKEEHAATAYSGGALASLSGLIASTAKLAGTAAPRLAYRALAKRDPSPPPAAPADAAAAHDEAAQPAGERGTAASPTEPPAAGRRDELGAAARERLSPALIALLETGSAAGVHVDGVRVQIAVRLRYDPKNEDDGGAQQAADAVRRLRGAGMDVEHTRGDCVTGWIEIAELEALAELAAVERIVAAHDPATGGDCSD